MKTKKFKQVAVVGMSVMMAFSVFVTNSMDIKAAEVNVSGELKVDELSSQIDSTLESYEQLTKEQQALYNEAIAIEVSKHQNDAGFDEEKFKNDINSFVFENNSSKLEEELLHQGMMRWEYTGIWLSNSVVASGINVAICLLTGGVGTVGIKMLVKQVGSKAAITAIEKAIKNKLIWFGLKQVTGITPIIKTIVNNLLDPGSAVANWYDSIDIRPNNGRCDVA